MKLLVRHLTLLFAFVLVVTGTASAQGNAQAADKKEPSIYDKIWRFATWYDDTDNPIVQRVLFTGRYHHDFAVVEADQGDTDEWNVRRMRLGPRITLFRDVTVHTEFEVNPQERDPFYVRITDAYVAWSRNPAAVITVGKHSVPFTQEGATSSRELLTIDRSNLANNLWFGQEYMPGVSASGRKNAWTYRGSLYSSGAANREFGEFNGGLFTLASLGYDFGKRLGVREATVTGNYVYQPADVNNTFTRRFEHITSLNFRLDNGRWGARGDLATGVGYLNQRDVWSFMLMPYFNITNKWQVVGRYTFVDSDGHNGVALPTYENRVARGSGDEYSEGYVGVNYYVYAHRLKLQSGVQFASMQDRANDGGAYSGTSWVTGLRIGW
jgi:phosphate-selective porin OprO and OprP